MNTENISAMDSPGEASKALRLSEFHHRRLIGLLGFSLPFILLLMAEFRQVENLPHGKPLGSISAYYYSGSVALFVGVVFSLALFLFTYRGYSDSSADRILGKIGGVAAFLVAVFPTEPPRGVAVPDWLLDTEGKVHLVAATILFTTFAIFALWLFRKTQKAGGPLTKAKRVSNRIYLGCGLVIVGAMAWAFLASRAEESIFWPEALALWAFSISWLVKGEAQRPIIRILKMVTRKV